MDVGDFKNLPPGIRLGPISAQVYQVLAQHTAFPWPILKTQAERLGFDPVNLTPSNLVHLTDILARGVERFTSPQTGAAVRSALERLMKR